MGREDLMRISRALALFRPSFLALIMNLTEEDLVFMEKCFQRTLLVRQSTLNKVWGADVDIACISIVGVREADQFLRDPDCGVASYRRNMLGR